ncbi:MAG: MlaD family protein [Actinomycetota bacterium]|nr:MlaD family protein [Actinomycetota bacterium]
MRRLGAIAAAVTALGMGAMVVTGSVARGGSDATFAVIFDDARGLVPGQLVKIAGAQAGTIQRVTVTPGFKARIVATVSSQFLPFHRDATCSIRPQGLIGENYVECDPGSAATSPLPASNGQPPTVPVSHTTEPVSLLDLFGIFNAPTRQRLTVLINELGISTAARGQDINQILRRANPTLGLARQVIRILSGQRGQLAAIVDATNKLAANGAGHTAALQRFLDRAAGLSARTAGHSGSLAQAVRRLPGMLAVTQPALRQLDTVAVDGTPLVRQIHAAVPALDRVASDLGPFVSAARPGLAQLGAAVSHTLPALRASGPLLRTLRRYGDRSRTGTLLSARLFANLERHGFAENFLSVAYYIGASLARFDATSHMLAILLVSPNNGACGNYATTPVPGCSAHYGSQPSYAAPAAGGRALTGLANYLLR